MTKTSTEKKIKEYINPSVPVVQKNRQVCHIPTRIYAEIRLFGGGDFQQGLHKVNMLMTGLNRNNNGVDKIKQNILMQDCDQLLEHLLELYPGLWQRFIYFNRFFYHFLQSRGSLDFNLFKGTHKEVTLDEVAQKSKDKGVK